MPTYVAPFCRIWGHDLTSIIHRGGVEGSGGELMVEGVETPYKKSADLRLKGRAPKKYRIKAFSDDRDIIEEFLDAVNTAPEGAEIYPFDAERRGLIGSAYATVKQPVNALGKWRFEAVAEVTCRESWLYGPAQGILYQEAVSLPKFSDLLTNEGQEAAGLDYLLARGNLAEDLSVRLTPDTSDAEHDKEIALCDKMMRGDVFRLDRAGNVEHSYDSSFDQTYAGLTADLHGSSFVSGGSIISSGSLVLGASGKFLMSFYGPLPACWPGPSLELWVSAITGTPDVEVAFETDLSDLAVVDFTPQIGYNKISIPNCEGADFVAFGIITDSGESVTLTRARGTVARYLAASAMPTVDVGEDFKIRVEATAGGLQAVQATYRDLFYY